MKKYSLLAAAYLGLSACSLASQQEVKTPLVDIGDSGTNLEATLKNIPADFSPENEIDTEDKIKVILDQLSQPGEYGISGVYLNSKNLNIKMYFSYCDYGLQFDYCNPNLSLMIHINSKKDEDNSAVFLADSPPYGSLDYSCFSNKIRSCKKSYREQEALAYEMFSKIVNEEYRKMIKDEEHQEMSKNKPHFIDRKIEIIFRNLTGF